MVFVAFNLVIPFLPLFIQELGVHDRAQVTALAGIQQTASSIGLAMFSPVWGLLGDRFGRKAMFLRAVSFGALVTGATALVGNITQLLVLRFFMGALTGVQGPAMALITSLAPRSRTAYAIGLIQMAVYSGTFAGPLIGGVVAASFGYRTAFISGAVLMAIAALAIFTQVHEEFAPPPPRDAKGSYLRDLRELVAGSHMLPLLVTIFFITFALFCIPPMMPLFVQNLPNLPGAAPTVTGIVLGTAGLFSAISAPLLGRLGPRIGYERILTVAALSAALAVGSIPLIWSVAPLVIVEVVLGFAAGGLMPMAFTLAALRTPVERRGSIYGLTSSTSASGVAVGPFAAGLLGAAAGVRPVFLLPAAVFLFVAGLSVLNRKSAPRSR